MSEKSTISAKKNKTKPASDKSIVSGNGRAHESGQENSVSPLNPQDQESSSHPWAPLLGKYADDPDWDELMEAIRHNREELDAEVSKAR